MILLINLTWCFISLRESHCNLVHNLVCVIDIVIRKFITGIFTALVTFVWLIMVTAFGVSLGDFDTAQADEESN
ncbi:hypothetical protein RchiOBHm_Chr2g0157691 [Rosa chinensis]|uniref:Uncharacterized protein n=1 Tax=Rosa chinensis TaxID=74649 RepID=A0A2P6S1U4_ROSCH|nr:hypothetical protein RchiOBHm_Chr2g0157691 [Rosa chinensis]